jgi:hypothetical protein
MIAREELEGEQEEQAFGGSVTRATLPIAILKVIETPICS